MTFKTNAELAEEYVPDPPVFTLRMGTPGGEVHLGTYESAEEALRERDYRREFAVNARRVIDVLNDDVVDPPETGVVEWCHGCEERAVLASAELCEECR
jgi:hypothetical protein